MADVMDAVLNEHFVFFLLGLFVCTLILALAYAGLWTRVSVDTKSPPHLPLVLAYKTGTGPYKSCGGLFSDAFSVWPEHKTMGIYYDDPEATPPEECRYAVGSILCSGADNKPDPATLELASKNGFRIHYVPRPEFCVFSEFPFKMTLSIFIAIWRVYPRLKEYILARGLCAYPALEIYETNKIQFLMPLSLQDAFLVTEFQPEVSSIATSATNVTKDKDDKESDIGSKKSKFSSSSSRQAQFRDEDIFAKPDPPKPKEGQDAIPEEAEAAGQEAEEPDDEGALEEEEHPQGDDQVEEVSQTD